MFAFLSRLYMPRHRQPWLLSTSKLRVGLRVEVQYYDFMVIKSIDAAGRRGQVPVPVQHRGHVLFGHGMYCVATVASLDRDSGRYTLTYDDGPFEQAAGPVGAEVHKKLRLFRRGTEFVDVDRAFIQVELSESFGTHFPFFLLGISALQLLAFFVYCATANEEPTMTTPTAGKPMLWFKLVGKPDSWRSANNDYPICNDLRPQAWRFWSYQLVHVGVLHVLFNVFLQLIMGIPLEMVHGSVRILFLYQTGVFMGAITCSVADVYSNVVGASGGVYCIVGIHIANLLVNWSEMKRSYWNHWVVLITLVIMVGLEVWETQMNR